MKRKAGAGKKILYEGKFVRLICEGTWEFIERRNATGIVIILAVTEEGKVLFTEQHRVPVGERVIEFPAGLVNDHGSENHETLETAAMRELLEETGYMAEKVVPIFSGPANAGWSRDMISIFKAVGLKKTGKGGGDETECITVHEVPLKQVPGWLHRMRAKGMFVDPKVYAGLYFLEKGMENGRK